VDDFWTCGVMHDELRIFVGRNRMSQYSSLVLVLVVLLLVLARSTSTSTSTRTSSTVLELGDSMVLPVVLVLLLHTTKRCSTITMTTRGPSS
jgi:uncharacterized membrane protein